MLWLLRGIKDEKDNAILGQLYVNGQFVCYTLENLSKAIPAEYYDLTNSKSPKFKRELPLVSNADAGVAPSRGIRIHSGNTVKDSAGCILVGMGANVAKFTLIESKAAEQMVAMLARNCRELVITESYSTTWGTLAWQRRGKLCSRIRST